VELIKLSLMAMFFCNGYAMDNREQIAKDLVRAQMLTAQAENQVAVAHGYLVDDGFNEEYIEFVQGQHLAAIELAGEAYAASLKIVNDNTVPHKVKKDAQLYAKKAFWILDKYNSK
jgi:hypothetical protein